jgi:[acyl-carrier-protein] S-malonyltransferase
MAPVLADIALHAPQIPVLQNVDAAVPATLEQIRENLLAQLYSPVLWTRTVQAMVEAGAETMVECGPGKVLSGLNKKVHKALNVVAINEPAGLAKALGE